MKLFYILLLGMLLPLPCCAQKKTIDTVRVRFSYAIKGTTTESSKQYDDELSVDIGDSVSYCYSRWEEDNNKLWEKVKAEGGTANDYLAQQGPFSRYFERDIKHYPMKDKQTIITFLYKYFLYEEPISQFDWQLLSGDTVIVSYPCKRAKCTYRGRTWYAWFTFDIPIHDGPWKLQGLPGMILAAKDQKNQFSFECIEIKDNLNTPMEVDFKKAIKSTPLKVQDLRKLEKSNPEAFDKAVGLKGIIWGFKPKSRVACLKEYY